jgi:hypothetical protein
MGKRTSSSKKDIPKNEPANEPNDMSRYCNTGFTALATRKRLKKKKVPDEKCEDSKFNISGVASFGIK